MIARMPTSMAVSLGLHGLALGAFLLGARPGPQQAQRIVDGVDLLIQSPKPREGAVKPPPLSTMDFLKLALPNQPRGAAPASISIKTEDRKVKLADAPKLDELARKELGPKVQALDLSEKRAEAAKVSLGERRRGAAAALAAMPRLEDVGRRRVKNLPEALALEEGRREAQAQGISLQGAGVKAPSRAAALAAVATLREAAPEEGRGSSRPGLAAMAPGQALDLRGARPVDAAPKPEKPKTEAPARPKQQQLAAAAPAKGVEIEGPLADRRVASYNVPPFPTWLQSQGILEASVGIRFTVDEQGAVMSGSRVVVSSGYGRLDKLALESLQSWRFEPKPGAGVQWGVITFRFVVE